MSTGFDIPQDARDRQRLASDPAHSAWVSAIAGSGKTHVLADRVIRLLVAGTKASRILCLTYTRAAAANMSARVFRRLGVWATADDATLDASLAALGAATGAAARDRARRLFAEALDVPGGLKIETIHAFCTRILHQFPFEAGVAAHFTVLDDIGARELTDRHITGALLRAAAEPDSRLGRDLASLMERAADTTLREVIDTVLADRATLARWQDPGNATRLEADLLRALGGQPGDTVAGLDAEALDSPVFPVADWPDAIALLETGADTETNAASALRRALGAAGRDRVALSDPAFLTQKGEARKAVVTKPFAKANPDLAAAMSAERDRRIKLVGRRRACETTERTSALFRTGAAIVAGIDREKAARGLLDYGDLIERTRDLFARVDASWVLYKLDLGIDHVLVDEAQDTSAAQWDIVGRLVGEFTAGAGARGTLNRTLFVVGDEKQSIFSFQGADPVLFDERRRAFGQAFREAGLGFERVPFTRSFRSSPDILAGIDAVFSREVAFTGLSADPVPTQHDPVRVTIPGEIEVWPLVEPEQKPEIDPWLALDALQVSDPRVRLAQAIAARLGTWLQHGESILRDGRPHPIRAGDVLILVRQRGPLFEAILKALKTAGLPVAGADRLVLTNHIAVMDLIALADALTLPADDLALATVLRSPLVGLTDDDLIRLAAKRPGTLRLALADAGHPAAAWVDGRAREAASLTPWQFYARLLGPLGGRRAFAARLGAEANEALDELLAAALNDETRHPPSLQGFVARLRDGGAQVKRDMDIARDEIRVMTVHGAKGLEAPVVILADTTSKPEGSKTPTLVTLPGVGNAGLPVWAGPKAGDTPALAAARADAATAARAEHKRLLYVALTRAEDRLIVCGALGRTALPDESWYRLVQDGLAPSGQAGEDRILRFRARGLDMPAPFVDPTMVAPQPPAPGWLGTLAPEPAAVLLRPSETGAGRATGNGAADVARRGRFVHRLLEVLPGLPPENRRPAAERALTTPDDAGLIDDVLRLIADPALADLFGPRSRAEVSVAGRLPTHDAHEAPILVAGQVDRLVVADTHVMICDFKSGTPYDPLPEAYIEQLALYRQVLAGVWPDRAIRAAIVWTASARLVEPSAADLDRALSHARRRAITSR
jgi:ATP-dependent helicase/nuclease subunit A